MQALVVDDSVTMRRIISNILTKLKFESIDEARDGREALIAVKAKQYDIIMMDWNMPNMSGLDAVKRIRGEGLKVPIIMVTTEAEKIRVLEAIKAGINGYLVKPFTPDDLKAKLADFIS